MQPSKTLHPAASAFRADTDIELPYLLDKLSHGKIAVPCPETLVPLEGEDQLQVFAFAPVIQEPVIPDLLEPGWEHMHQVAAYKFRVFQSNCPARPARLLPPGREGDLLFINGQDTAVGNGNLMSIPAKVFNGIAEPVEGFFYVWTPVLLIKGIAERRPFIRIAEFFTGRGNVQSAVFIKRIQAGKIFPFELVTEYLYRYEKTVFCLPYLMVRGKAAAGDNTVHMHMVTDLLVPGMKDLDDPGCCAKVLFISGQFQERLRTAFVDEPIKALLVAVNEGIEFMRQCEYHMEVGSIDHLGPAFVHPELFLHSLAVGAVTVAAGTVVELHMPAVRADGDIDAEPSGFAVQDGKGSLALDIRLGLSGITVTAI